MLNLEKLIKQIQNINKDSLLDKSLELKQLTNALEALEKASENDAQMYKILSENAPWVLWPIALPIEPFGSSYDLAPEKLTYTAVGIDGSQIMPSHHEIYNCYLLNIGTTVISYGFEHETIMDSEPTLYHQKEDLYPLVDRRRIHIDELYVSLERYLHELESAKNMAIKALARKLPVIAFIDGSLIPWSLEKMPESYQNKYRQTLSNILDELYKAKIPLFGYISHSRASDLVNDLRVWQCPYDTSHCYEYCGHLNEENFPCSSVWPLTDRTLMMSKLSTNSRSAAYLSGASVSKVLPSNVQISFTYLNIGSEVARLEFPNWLVKDKALFELSLKAVISQCEKGLGYPICLSEAHNLAIIRANDRKQFFDLFGKRLIELGVGKLQLSPKETSKRKSIV